MRDLDRVMRKENGVHATNQDFRRYERVAKPQTYQLAEIEPPEAFDDEFVIRTCDLRSPTFVDELGSALQEIGFAILVGHGIDPALYDEAHDRVAEMFERLALEEKLRFRAKRHGSVNQGYFPVKETSNMHPDLVEGWVFCRRAFEAARAKEFWPLPEYAVFFDELVTAQERLILPVMQSLLAHLGCDPHFYDRRLTGTNFGLRLNYYPPMSHDDEASGAARLLGHEDVDLFTFLPAPRTEVLEVLPCFEEPKYPPVKAIEFHTGITSKFYGDDYAVTLEES
jgi:isopenicillin N synthase-like dioxygenase